MKYKELKSLYYSDSEEYIKEYNRRFNSEDTVHINLKIGDNTAFFTADSIVYKLCYEIEKKDKRIALLCRELPIDALSQYSRKCLIDEIVITNNIEGVNSSKKEIGEVLERLEQQSAEKNKEMRFRGIVNKYLKLINSEKIIIKSCEDIRAIYDEAFLEEVLCESSDNFPDGKLFRKDSVSVYSSTDRVIHKGVMPESKIIEYMESAVNFLNDESVEKLFRVCLFHYLIEYIHPFYDGNGRFGRLVFSFGLADIFCSLVSLKISSVIKENISMYYKGFVACNNPLNKGDITPFLIMMLKMVNYALDDLENSLSEKLSDYNKYLNLIKELNLHSENELKLYIALLTAELFGEKGLCKDELTERINCSKYSLTKIIQNIDSKYIKQYKRSKYKIYTLDLDNLSL